MWSDATETMDLAPIPRPKAHGGASIGKRSDCADAQSLGITASIQITRRLFAAFFR